MDAKIRAVFVAVTGALLLVAGADALGQSARPYQMTVYPSVGGSNASVDIPMFTRGVFMEQPQPPGRSIVWLHPDTQSAQLDQYGIDWSRIAAVYVDEPYLHFVSSSRSCAPPGVATRRANLVNLAAAVRSRAPAARFWVNFNSLEVELMMTEACSFNESYIDVVSMDMYYNNFNTRVRRRYEFLSTHRPTGHQQLALVVPVFTAGTPPSSRFSPQTAAQGVARLTEYLAYAARKNRTCRLPLGPTGITGTYDGCPVWAVAGFMGGVAPPADDTALLPIDNPASARIFGKWQEKFAVERIDPGVRLLGTPGLP
jgi:hypothetical protein